MQIRKRRHIGEKTNQQNKIIPGKLSVDSQVSTGVSRVVVSNLVGAGSHRSKDQSGYKQGLLVHHVDVPVCLSVRRESRVPSESHTAQSPVPGRMSKIRRHKTNGCDHPLTKDTATPTTQNHPSLSVKQESLENFFRLPSLSRRKAFLPARQPTAPTDMPSISPISTQRGEKKKEK